MDTNLDQLERGGGTIQGAGIRDYLQTILFHICIQIIFASGDSMIAAAQLVETGHYTDSQLKIKCFLFLFMNV